MNVIRIFVAADGVHIRIQSLAWTKAIFMQCKAFPFCKGMYDFCILSVLFLDIKYNRPLYAV